MKATSNRSSDLWLHSLLLLFWLALGIGLRFTNLAAKPPWSDEWATMVFSLGHSFSMVPLNRPISLDTLLLPLQLDPSKGVSDVFTNLMNDSTHPPLYFILSHWWLKLSSSQGLVSVWLTRSLSALLGALAVPAMFGLGWLVCRSRSAGQMAAALMAVSPYGIYLSQEARHYTLAILWIVASLACFAIAIEHLYQRTALPISILVTWVGVNSLGIATHYFFILSLAAQFLVLFGVWVLDFTKRLQHLFAPSWRRIYAAIAGTSVGILIWLPALQRIPGNRLTNWIYEGSNFIDAMVRLLAWGITMVFLLPVEGTPAWVTVLSGIVVLLTLFWLTPALIRGWRAWTSIVLQALFWYIVASIALIFGITYFLNADLTVAARFQFTYFPALLLLLGAILSQIWQESHLQKSRRNSFYLVASRLGGGELAVIVTLTMGLFGGLTVVHDLGYQKFERPDLVLAPLSALQTNSLEPVLLTTSYKSHGQTAEMLGLAWQLHHQANSLADSAHFLLVDADDPQRERVVKEAIAQFPRLHLWLVNFSNATEIEAESLGCTTELEAGKAPGYRYQSYQCFSDRINRR